MRILDALLGLHPDAQHAQDEVTNKFKSTVLLLGRDGACKARDGRETLWGGGGPPARRAGAGAGPVGAWPVTAV